MLEGSSGNSRVMEQMLVFQLGGQGSNLLPITSIELDFVGFFLFCFLFLPVIEL